MSQRVKKQEMWRADVIKKKTFQRLPLIWTPTLCLAGMCEMMVKLYSNTLLKPCVELNCENCCVDRGGEGRAACSHEGWRDIEFSRGCSWLRNLKLLPNCSGSWSWKIWRVSPFCQRSFSVVGELLWGHGWRGGLDWSSNTENCQAAAVN